MYVKYLSYTRSRRIFINNSLDMVYILGVPCVMATIGISEIKVRLLLQEWSNNLSIKWHLTTVHYALWYLLKIEIVEIGCNYNRHVVLSSTLYYKSIPVYFTSKWADVMDDVHVYVVHGWCYVWRDRSLHL